MQFIDLAAQQKRIRPQINARIKAVLDHGKYIMGPEVIELEERLADFVGVKYCVSCANGTDALLMALMAYGIGPGDAIFTTPFTFIATSEVISLLGATPVFVDIDPRTFNIDPQKIESEIKNLGQRTADSKQPLVPKGIIPVDLFGLPADYDSINKVAKEHGLFIIEDAAQGLGSEYKGRKAGSLADIATTSFFPAKPLGCYGDGGAIFTDDKKIAEKLRSIRVHGQGNDKYANDRIGINGRLDTLQAAILLSKLEIFPDEIVARQEVANKYHKGLNVFERILTPLVPKDCQSVWAQYSVLSENREFLRGELQQKGIPTAVYYPKPLHLQRAYADLNYKKGDFPVSEEVSSRIFSLPMDPYLEEASQQRVFEVLSGSLRKAK